MGAQGVGRGRPAEVEKLGVVVGITVVPAHVLLMASAEEE